MPTIIINQNGCYHCDGTRMCGGIRFFDEHELMCDRGCVECGGGGSLTVIDRRDSGGREMIGDEKKGGEWKW